MRLLKATTIKLSQHTKHKFVVHKLVNFGYKIPLWYFGFL